MTEFEVIKNALMRVDPEYVEINEKHYLGHGNWERKFLFLYGMKHFTLNLTSMVHCLLIKVSKKIRG